MTEKPAKPAFTRYEWFVVGILAFLQFTIIMDFMIMAPLGAMVMPALHILPRQFGLAVSVYAFSAAASGFLAAGFADRFDRKRLLLFFYAGFLLGTALCAIAPSYPLLMAARIVTGLFGGVIGSVVMAIVTDLFPLEMRGRVMGVIQTAFAASQILGLPAGVYFASEWNWHAPFVAILVVAVPVSAVIAWGLKPVTGHLALRQEHSPFRHLLNTLQEPRYLQAFAVTALLTTGGFMLMPFSSAFLVSNVHIALSHLPVIYLSTGICTMFAGPLIGRFSDQFGKFNVFLFGSILSIITVTYWTRVGPLSLLTVIGVNMVMFVAIFSRMIPAQALLSAIPEPSKRGAFNAVSASLQQFCGGIAAMAAGLVVVQETSGKLDHYDWVGNIVIMTSLLSLFFMYRVHKMVPEAGTPAIPVLTE